MTISRGHKRSHPQEEDNLHYRSASGEHGLLGHSYAQDSGGRCLTEVEADAEPQGYSMRRHVWLGAGVSVSCDSLLRKCDLGFTEI